MSDRPLINDTPGQPAHPMTDDQYAEYLRVQEEMSKRPSPQPTAQDQIDTLKAENAELKAMIQKLSEV